jgi:Ni/Fe-hydrogenase subunit HybB-like protein
VKMQIALPPRVLRFRPSLIAVVLVALMAIGLLVALARFAYGIGAISNLSNTYPWGFWISFDIYTGIAISSGAYLLAAAVYIFDLKDLRPLLMPSILTALIGYFMEVLALMVDLGRPERIFNMLFFQNYTSHMLVVGLCVMIYLFILAVEFGPVILRGIKRPGLADSLHRFIKPVVILGVVVSTVHQGSLGSLLLIQSAKLYPLWWTPLLPVMFFVSSISIGLAMIIFESSLSSRHFFGKFLETDLLAKLAKAIPPAVGVYAILKFGQLVLGGNSGFLFRGGILSVLFWAEIILGVVIPAIIFLVPRNRQNPRTLLIGAIILLFGMILNRFNVSWFGIQRLQDVGYVPSLAEISISAAIFSFGIMAFGLAARYLPVFEDPEATAAKS